MHIYPAKALQLIPAVSVIPAVGDREAFAQRVRGASDDDEAWLFDPQTAGGLLLAIAEPEVERVQRCFDEAGEPPVRRVGRFVADDPGRPGSIEIED